MKKINNHILASKIAQFEKSISFYEKKRISVQKKLKRIKKQMSCILAQKDQ